MARNQAPDTAIRGAAPMKRARAVQLAMLPKAPAIPGLDIHAFCEPCEAVGGDFYDFIAVSPYELGIVIGDVSGHGIDAALMMASAKKNLHICAQGRSSPRETLLIVADDLASELPPNSFISIFYGVIDLRRGALTYASAGHNPPLLASPSREPRVAKLSSKGTVLGASLARSLAATLSEETLVFSPGDTLVLFTDGLTESVNESDAIYGDARLQDQVGGALGQSAGNLADFVLGDVARFRGPKPQSDDLTLVTLRFLCVADKITQFPLSRGKQPILTNLRLAASSFVGRAAEVARLEELLLSPNPLVTLAGVAGTGKTRLAQVVGRNLLPRFSGGVWFVDLSAARTERDVCVAVASTVGIPLGSGKDAVGALAAALAFRKPMLLILDNFEQVADEAAAAVLAWHKKAPKTALLITSRAVTGIEGEQEFRLKPLSFPQKRTGAVVADHADERSEAVELFMQRALAVQPGLAGEPGAIQTALAICAELEGIPLAIELAAARLRSVSLQGLLAQIREPSGRLQQTAEAAHDSNARQKTMQDAIAWSYQLLADWEKAAFVQLSVFEGGFFLEAAEAVLDLSFIENAPDVVAAVQSLYDKSLLVGDETPFGRRFRFFGSIRDYGQAQAAQTLGDAEFKKLKRRHMDYFAAHGWSLCDAETSYEPVERIDRLELELANFAAGEREAELAGEADKRARLIMARGRFLNLRGTRREAMLCYEGLDASGLSTEMRAEFRLARLAALIGQVPVDVARAEAGALVHDAEAWGRADWIGRALALQAEILTSAGDLDNAKSVIARAREFLSHDNRRQLCELFLVEATIEMNRARLENALPLLDEADKLARAVQSIELQARSSNFRGYLLRQLGRLSEAMSAVDAAESLYTKLRGRTELPSIIGMRGIIYRAQGRLDEALECYERAENLCREIGDKLDALRHITNRGFVLWFLDDFAGAAAAAEEALVLARESGEKIAIATVLSLLGRSLVCAGQYSRALQCLRESGAIFNEVQSRNSVVLDLALEAVALLGLGENEEAEEAAREATTLAIKMNERPGETLLVCYLVMAKIAHAGRKSAERDKWVSKAREIIAERGFDQYSNSHSIHFSFRLLDELARPAGAGREENIKVRCKDCGRKMSAPRARFERQKSCPHCHAAPFVYVIV